MKNNDIYIPERFQKAILVHLFKNLWAKELPSVPLVLGIHGPSGVGKTFQCQRILEDLDAQVFLISGGEMESKDAGEPARLVRHTYLRAGEAILEKKTNLAVLVINDIDTGLGNWGENVQTTVNTQIVAGELMHITDFPMFVENQPTLRIPIIVTGNDFTKLYSPLIRAGRMTSFEWKPTIEEKTQIVSRIFQELSEMEAGYLVSELSNYAREAKRIEELDIAIFTEIRSTMYDEHVWHILQRNGVGNVLEKYLIGKMPSLKIDIDISRVMQVGKKLIDSSRHTNHLIRIS